MVMYGAITGLEAGLTQDCVVVNFSSFYEGIQRVPLLPNNWQYTNIEEFDTTYWNWIMGNDNIFMVFMQAIAYPIYAGKDVFILMNDELTDGFNESLLKLLQIRYGVYANRIDTIEDLFIAKDYGITPMGYNNFHNDIDRMDYLLESNEIYRKMQYNEEFRNEIYTQSRIYNQLPLE